MIPEDISNQDVLIPILKLAFELRLQLFLS